MQNEFELNQKGYILTKDHSVCEAKIIGFIGGELVVDAHFSGCQTIPTCDFFKSEQEAYDKAIWLIKAELERCVAELAQWNSKLDAIKTLYGLSVKKEKR